MTMDPLQTRAQERKIYEAVVEMVVDFVCQEVGYDTSARMRIYLMVAENFKGMVEAMTPDPTRDFRAFNGLEETD